DDLRSYLRQFINIATAVKKRNQLDEYTETLWFVQGLPADVARQVLKKGKLKVDEAETMKVKAASDALTEILDQKEELSVFLHHTGSNKDYESLAQAYQPPLPSKPDFRPAATAPVAGLPVAPATAPAMEELIKSMNA